MKKTIWAMFAIIVIMFGIVVWGFFEYVYEPREVVDITEEIEEQEDKEDDEDSETEGEEEDEFDPSEVETRSVPAAFADGDIIYTEVTERHSVKLLDPFMSAMQAAENQSDYPRDITEDYIFNFVDLNEVGVVASGDYAGYKLLTMNVICEGPCFGESDYLFLYDEPEEEFIFLESHSTSSTSYAGFLKPLFANSSSMFLDGIEAPNSLTLPGGESIYLTEAGAAAAESIREYYVKLYNDSTFGQVYYNESQGCYYLISPDDVVNKYEQKLEFVTGSDNIRLPNGKYAILNEDYQLEAGGCGIAGSCYNTYEVDESNLKSIGTSGSGQEFFVPIKYDEAANHSSYRYDIKGPAGLYNMHIRYGVGSESFSYDDYIDEAPMLFWKDPFNRWSTLVKNEYAPVAECAKPVIYLYPEQKSTVSVKVLLEELTVTEPEHGEDGWTVEAKPNGDLINLVDGTKHDYLFWEGHKDAVLEAEAGFMVEKSEVKKFLKSSLKEMGFNRAERNDFMEFWLPVMMSYDHPRFFVSFVGTEDFNKVAPLEVSPTPDTMYRMFMYFEPTYNERKVIPQQLGSFDRDGFALVEWGGTSSIPWE